MLAHGLVSPALFIAVTVLYDRHKTRLIKYYRGVGVQMPHFSVLFLLLILLSLHCVCLYQLSHTSKCLNLLELSEDNG